jgi:hypothetical protein
MYSAYDLKNCRYLYRGRNSNSYGECFEAIKHLLAFQSWEDWEDEPDKKLLNFFKVRIDQHRKEI